MKRKITVLTGSVLLTALVASYGMDARAMERPIMADANEETQSLSDKIDALIGDADTGAMFTNREGYWAGDVYVNPMLGYSIEVPDDMELTAGEDGDGIDYLLVGMDEVTQEAFQLALIDPEAATDADMTVEECLEAYKQSLVESAGIENADEEMSDAVLGSNDYTLLTLNVDQDGQAGTVRFYCREVSGLFEMITVLNVGDSSEQSAAMLDSITPLELGVWNDRTYTNEIFDISLTIPEGYTITKNPSIEDGAAYPFIAVDDATGSNFQIVLFDLEQMGDPEELADYDAHTMLKDFNSGIEETSGYPMSEAEFGSAIFGDLSYDMSFLTVDDEDIAEITTYGCIVDHYAMVMMRVDAADGSEGNDAILDSYVPAEGGCFGESTYINMPLQLQIGLLDSWEIYSEYTLENGYAQALFIGDPNTGENIQLQVYDLEELGSEDMTADDYKEILRQNIEARDDYEITDDSGTMVMGGAPYDVVTAQTELDGVTMEQKFSYRIVDGYLYCFIFTAEAGNYTSDYETVLDSMAG